MSITIDIGTGIGTGMGVSTRTIIRTSFHTIRTILLTRIKSINPFLLIPLSISILLPHLIKQHTRLLALPRLLHCSFKDRGYIETPMPFDSLLSKQSFVVFIVCVSTVECRAVRNWKQKEYIFSLLLLPIRMSLRADYIVDTFLH